MSAVVVLLVSYLSTKVDIVYNGEIQCLYTVVYHVYKMGKNSQVISYRLSEAEVEALKQLQQSGESLNQTAQRLLREAIGLSTPGANASPAALSTLSTEIVDSRIDEKLAPIHSQLAQLNERLLEREGLREETQSLRQSAPLPNLHLIRDRVLKSWRVGKRAESKERIREALNQFIEAIEQDSDGQTLRSSASVDNI